VKIYYLHRGDNIPFYIGKTKDINNRKSGHRLKYGLDVCIEVIDDVDDWKFEEDFYINMFRSWGFDLVNQNKGGGGLSKHSTKTKQKIKNTWKVKSILEKNKINQKRGLGNKGKSKPKSGYREWKQEHIDRVISTSPFNQPNWSDKCKKPINMVDKNTNTIIRQFDSVTEASYIVKVNQSSISHALNGKSKTCKGYKWKYQ